MSKILSNYLKSCWKSLITTILIIGCLASFTQPAFAGIDDDRYDGNVFVLYAGNGSLVPARVSLADSLKAPCSRLKTSRWWKPDPNQKGREPFDSRPGLQRGF